MMKLSLLPFAFVAALSAPLAPTSSSLRTSVTHRPVSRSLVNSRERFALSSRKQTSFKKEEQASIRKQLVTRAQEVQENSSPIPFIAPPVALAAAYALVKLSPLDQALTTFIEGNGYPQMFRDLAMPGFFYNWFHAANMAIVAGAMGGYGAWLGFETKAGRGNEEAWGALNGATKRELHTQLMAGAGLIFAAGGLGGVTFILTLQKSLFESPHAITGFAELMLFATQAGLALSMKQNPGLRQAHATLGAITMGILATHATLGIKLGLGL
eukprot:jgi/Bigna1/143858/aug1.82_g18566